MLPANRRTALRARLAASTGRHTTRRSTPTRLRPREEEAAGDGATRQAAVGPICVSAWLNDRAAAGSVREFPDPLSKARAKVHAGVEPVVGIFGEPSQQRRIEPCDVGPRTAQRWRLRVYVVADHDRGWSAEIAARPSAGGRPSPLRRTDQHDRRLRAHQLLRRRVGGRVDHYVGGGQSTCSIAEAACNTEVRNRIQRSPS